MTFLEEPDKRLAMVTLSGNFSFLDYFCKFHESWPQGASHSAFGDDLCEHYIETCYFP